MRILKRPMFKKGGSANEGIMDGLVDRRGYAQSNAADLFMSIGGEKIYGPDSPWGLEPTFSAADVRNFEPSYTQIPISDDWRNYLYASGDPSSEKGDVYTKKWEGTTIEERAKDANVSVPEMIAIEKDIKTTETKGGTYVSNQIAEKAKKKGEVTIDRTKGYDVNSFEDRKSRMSRRQKEFLEMLSPQAKQRAMIDAATAASEAFGESTGDTKQDIANAITAAAKATGGIQDLSMMARKLAIEEDIKLSTLEKEWEVKGRTQKDSDKIKTMRYLMSEAGGSMSVDEARALAFGQFTSADEAILAAASKDASGFSDRSIYAGTKIFYDARGHNIVRTTKENWAAALETGKDQLDDGIYVVGKKVYQITTKDGKKQPPKLIHDYSSET